MNEIFRVLFIIYAVIINAVLIFLFLKHFFQKYYDKYKILKLSKTSGIPDYLLKNNPEYSIIDICKNNGKYPINILYYGS
jgi:hypothetical protein